MINSKAGNISLTWIFGAIRVKGLSSIRFWGRILSLTHLFSLTEQYWYAERYPLGHFHDFHERNRGWCNRFDHPAKTHHIKTNDCILNTDTEKVEPFPTEVIELDRDGYPIEEVSPTGYFSADFLTNRAFLNINDKEGDLTFR